MEYIYISGFEGKTITIPIPSSKFKNFKISELKFIIRDRTGFEVEHQRLVYGTKELQNESCGHIRTLSDYDISDGATIMLIARLPGGGSPSFIPLNFADITSEDKFKPTEFDPSAPKWRKIGPGLSFTGICKQSGCAAFNSFVYVIKGFYKSTNGQCMLNSEVFNLKCPMCHKELKEEHVLGVGIYKCKLTVKYLAEGAVAKHSYDIVSKDKYKYAGCMDKKDKIKYVYVILIVKKL